MHTIAVTLVVWNQPALNQRTWFVKRREKTILLISQDNLTLRAPCDAAHPSFCANDITVFSPIIQCICFISILFMFTLPLSGSQLHPWHSCNLNRSHWKINDVAIGSSAHSRRGIQSLCWLVCQGPKGFLQRFCHCIPEAGRARMRESAEDIITLPTQAAYC